MHAAAEWGKHTDAPVAQLVAHALDNDGAIIGDRRCGSLLIGKEANEIFRRLRIEIVVAHQAADRGVARQLTQLANERADAPSKFERAPGKIAMPEGHFAWLAGCRAKQARGRA